MNKEYLSVTEFAKKYDKDPSRVRRMVSEVRIKAIKIGNLVAIPVEKE